MAASAADVHSAPRVLLVEDDPTLSRSFRIGLQHAGYVVRCAADGTAIDEQVEGFRPDLVVLDVSFPTGPDGFAIARRVRALTDCPLLFVTAADSLDARLEGFALGGDDYVVKPLAVAELLARTEALLRRCDRLASPVRVVRDLVIDGRQRTVMRAGRVIELTPTEFDLLYALARVPGEAISKLQLLSLVWGFEEYDPNLVEVYVSSLRKKLRGDGPPLIRTQRGSGYVLGP